MKYVPDAFAAPAYDRMSRLPRGIGTVSVSGTCKEAQSANSPSIRIPAGTLKKYASRPTPTTVTGRGAGADWRETETGSPEGSPAPEPETTTDAVGEAWVRVTCGEDGDTVSPLVAAKVNGPTVHAPDGPTSPIATTSRRSAGVVPDDRIPASGTCSIRIAPKAASPKATLARDTEPSKSSPAMRIVEFVWENAAKSSVGTRTSRYDPATEAATPRRTARRLQFISESGGNSKRRAEVTVPDPPTTSATKSAPIPRTE